MEIVSSAAAQSGTDSVGDQTERGPRFFSSVSHELAKTALDVSAPSGSVAVSS
jgi:hypothetical protein